MFKRKQYIGLGVIAMCVVTLMALPARTTQKFKLAVGSLFLPLFGLASVTQHAASKAGDAVTPRRELLRQNEALQRENQELKILAERAENLRVENERLRRLLDWQQSTSQHYKWKLKLATVVLREPSNWWRNIQIDLGSRDGVTNNLPVLTVDGYLAGRISSVGLTRSQVILLGDPLCKASARVENEQKDVGIIGGAGPIESEFVEMSYLPRTAHILPGQTVKTSGEGGIFPRDLPIGKIIDVRPVEYGLLTSARVKLGANLSALDEVWVLLK